MPSILMTMARPTSYGAARVATDYVHALVARGHRVTVCHGGRPTSSSGDAGATDLLTELSDIGVRLEEASLLKPVGGRPVRELMTLAEEVDADLLIGTQLRDMPSALRAASHLGLPGIYLALNLPRFLGPTPLRWVKSRLYQSALRGCATHVVAVSPAVQKELVERYQVPPEKISIVLNAIDADSFTPPEPTEREQIRRQLGLAPDVPMVVNVGRFSPQKAQDLMLPAWRKAIDDLDLAKPPQLFLIGDAEPGEKRAAEYKQRVDDIRRQLKLTDSVHFLGWRDDCRELVGAADLYVQASRWEGLSLSLLEALSLAVPVVQTDCVGRLPGFQHGIHGFYAQTGDHADIANQVVTALQLPNQERAHIGRQGRLYVEENCSLSVSAERFAQAIETQVNEVTPAGV